ncbi:MAG TPA: SDR family oxidoreductase [Burkholderiales bacterium]|nr:SDR family oxidoreductase [Burkholderiales bacterium]
MNILVFGATGATGQQVVKQALSQGHAVTAFVRNPGALPRNEKYLRVVIGDTTRDTPKIVEAMRGQDVVISALGRRSSFKSDHLIERSVRAIVSSMECAGIRRLIVVSALGVGESRRDAPLIPRIMYRVLLSDIFADKKAAEDGVRSSNLDWTFVYPVLLTEGPMTGAYRVGERLELHGLPKISRSDVAHFILTEIGNRAFVRKVAVISY